MITQYGSRDASACQDHEHDDLVQAIERGDEARASRLMQEHLRHVEASIQAPRQADDGVDFGKIFGVGGTAPATRRRG